MHQQGIQMFTWRATFHSDAADTGVDVHPTHAQGQPLLLQDVPNPAWLLHLRLQGKR